MHYYTMNIAKGKAWYTASKRSMCQGI